MTNIAKKAPEAGKRQEKISLQVSEDPGPANNTLFVDL